MEYQFTVPELISELLARAHIADIVSERWGSDANQGAVAPLREAAERLQDCMSHGGHCDSDERSGKLGQTPS